MYTIVFGGCEQVQAEARAKEWPQVYTEQWGLGSRLPP